jgi:O-antigen/teichoic acid export membrane protein
VSRLSKNIVYNFLGQTLLLVLGFIAVRYIFRQLGEDALGIIYFTATMTAILSGVLEKGIYSTTIREVASNIYKEPGYIQSFIQTGSFFSWIIYLIFSITVFWLSPILVEHWIHLTTIDGATATYILRILGIASLLVFPISFYASLLRGKQRMEFNNIIDVIASAIQQLGLVVLLIISDDLLMVVYWIAFCYFLKVLSYFLTCSRFFSLSSFLPLYSHKVIVKNSKFALNMIYISILAMVQKQADKLMISKMMPIGLLGYYGFVFGALNKAGLITSSIAQAAYPSLCTSYDENDKTALVAKFKELQDLVCLVTVPIFAGILFAAMPTLTFIFDYNTAKLLQVPVMLLCLGFYLNGTMAIPYRIILTTDKPEIAVRQNFYAIFSVLPITFGAIYLYGLSGAALGWVIYFLFSYIYSVPRIFKECLNLSPWLFYSHIFRILLLATLTYGSAYIIISIAISFNIMTLIVTYLVASLFYFAGVYIIVGEGLRKLIYHRIKSIASIYNYNKKASSNVELNHDK